MTKPTLKDVLEGRRKWLEKFAARETQQSAEKITRDILEAFQGLDDAAIFDRMKGDYLNLLYRGLFTRARFGNTSSGMEQIDYLIMQLAQLEAWKTAGFPSGDFDWASWVPS
jgi:hypothetical protein